MGLAIAISIGYVQGEPILGRNLAGASDRSHSLTDAAIVPGRDKDRVPRLHILSRSKIRGVSVGQDEVLRRDGKGRCDRICRVTRFDRVLLTPNRANRRCERHILAREPLSHLRGGHGTLHPFRELTHGQDPHIRLRHGVLHELVERRCRLIIEPRCMQVYPKRRPVILVVHVKVLAIDVVHIALWVHAGEMFAGGVLKLVHWQLEQAGIAFRGTVALTVRIIPHGVDGNPSVHGKWERPPPRHLADLAPSAEGADHGRVVHHAFLLQKGPSDLIGDKIRRTESHQILQRDAALGVEPRANPEHFLLHGLPTALEVGIQAHVGHGMDGNLRVFVVKVFDGLAVGALL
mmetsp:Transcript_1181/g.3792  ORF Transcript_1181/g.3792 Transcript_1181/m.3792 type:complete len:347 (-) Transcript_1181:2020-3060(-)